MQNVEAFSNSKSLKGEIWYDFFPFLQAHHKYNLLSNYLSFYNKKSYIYEGGCISTELSEKLDIYSISLI